MKTAENVNIKAISQTIPAETKESWEESLEERFFWKCDSIFTKVYTYILVFFCLYIVAHLLASM